MKRESAAPVLSAVFVDYDNIYMSLRRKSEEAARRFAKDAAHWLRALETGSLFTANPGFNATMPRRIVMARCYGNPVPRRNAHDNATDMNSFPFVRNNFLRAGFEIVDCPPLTQQMKNASDIRMVMDMRDYLTHDTYFDEFVILSGDADFTPVLHRLRQHARRTVVYANDHTAAPYTAISDGEVREVDLIAFLLREMGQGQDQGEGDGSFARAEAAAPKAEATRITVTEILRPFELHALPGGNSAASPVQAMAASGQAAQVLRGEVQRGEVQRNEDHVDAESTRAPQPASYAQPKAYQPTAGYAAAGRAAEPRVEPPQPQYDLAAIRTEIIDEVVSAIRSAPAPVPLEALAERATRVLGHERTIGTRWAGAGYFIELLRQGLPADVRLSDIAPFYAFDGRRQLAAAPDDLGPIAQPTVEVVRAPLPVTTQASQTQVPQAQVPHTVVASRTPVPAPVRHAAAPQAVANGPEAAPAIPALPGNSSVGISPRARLIERVAKTSGVPALVASDYRILFDALADELLTSGLQGEKTFASIGQRLTAENVTVRREDIKLVFDIISKPDPWFEKGVDTKIFANRFRNHIIAACRDRGVLLSAADLDVIDDLVLGRLDDEPSVAPEPQVMVTPSGRSVLQRPASSQDAAALPQQNGATAQANGSSRWWALDDAQTGQNGGQTAQPEEAMPRFVRARGR